MKWAIIAIVFLGLAVATWRRPRLTSTILWSLTATVFSTSALILMMPTDLKQTLLWVSVAIPLIWLGCMFWSHWDRRPYRPALSLLTVTIIGVVLVVQLPSPVGA